MFHVKQSEIAQHVSCPCCGNEEYITYLELEDYFLSHESFRIVKCKNCGLLKTYPQPGSNELGKYYKSVQYLSHATHNKGVDFFIYNRIRKLMLSRKVALIKKHAAGNNLLDIGCATGVFIDYCQQKGFKVEGIEPDEKARNYARKQLGLTVNDLNHLCTFPKKSFDIVTMWHVLEHVNDLDERMRLVHHILTNDGTVIIALPNPASFDAQYYKKYWAAYDVPRHLYHFNQNAFSLLSERYGFKITHRIPLVYDSYYISLLSERYMTGKSSYLKALWLGLRSNIYARKHNMDYSSIIYILKKSV